MHARLRLLAALVGVPLAAAAVTAVLAELTRPAVQGWADTVGFTAGLLVALAGAGAVLRRTAAPRS